MSKLSFVTQSRLSFYCRLPVVEKCLKKCLWVYKQLDMGFILLFYEKFSIEKLSILQCFLFLGLYLRKWSLYQGNFHLLLQWYRKFSRIKTEP